MISLDHAPRLNLQTSSEKGKKAFELGVLLKNNTKLSGADFHFKRYFGKNEDFHKLNFSKGINTRFYFLYNLVYNRHEAVEGNPDYLTMQYNIEENHEQTSQVTTLEHYVGLGMQIKLTPRLHLDGSMSFGAYLGTPNYQGGPLEKLAVHKKNEGLGASFRLGVSYDLKFATPQKSGSQEGMTLNH